MARRILAIMRHGGTHLVKPILKQTIGSSKGGKGDTILKFPTGGEVIVCTRDPRNRIVSSFRYKQFRVGRHPSASDDHDELLSRYMAGTDIVQYMHKWADQWMGLPNAHYISFEDFLTEDSAVLAVSGAAEYTGIEVTEEAIRNLWLMFYRNSPTYTGKHSRWQDWFGTKSRAVWKSHNGKLLTKKMGYR